MDRRTTVISLLDVGLFVQRELGMYRARRRSQFQPEKYLDSGWRAYDSSSFLKAILKDIFDNTAEQYPDEYLIQAKALLQNAGMDSTSAHQLCNAAIDMTIAYVSDLLPHLVFHDLQNKIRFDLQSQWDLLITEYV